MTAPVLFAKAAQSRLVLARAEELLAPIAHLPGRHDQKTHGRRKKKLPEVVDFDPDQPRDRKGRWTDSGLTGTAAVQAGDFSGLTRISGQQGSNPGGLYQDSDGQKWYVKDHKSERHAKSEALASALYKELRIDVAEVHSGGGAPGLDSEHQTASKWEEGLQDGPLMDNLGTFGLQDIQYGFAADAWLANWDVAGLSMDNIRMTPWDAPIRLDQGGALEFRAQGGLKGDAFGDTVPEFDTMRDANMAPQAARLFGSMDDDMLAMSAELLPRATRPRIRELVAEHGLEPELADKLIARRDDVVRRGELIRLNMAEAKGENTGSRGEKTGRAALEAAPSRLPDRDGTSGANPDLEAQLAFKNDPGWSDEKRERISRKLRLYRGGTFREIGAYLRGQESSTDITVRDGVQITEESVLDHIVDIDEAMAASKLSEPIESWRGLQDPEKVFGDLWSDEPGSMVGVEWDEKSFSSTSPNRGNASAFGGQTLLRLHMPAGVGAIQLSGYHTGERPRNEAEILMDRNVRARIIGDSIDPETMDRRFPTRIFDVEIRPIDDGTVRNAGGIRVWNRSNRRLPRKGAQQTDGRIVLDYPVGARRVEPGHIGPNTRQDPRLTARVPAPLFFDRVRMSRTRILGEFQESKVKRDRKGRFAEKNAAAVLSELDDAMDKLRGLMRHMSEDEREGLDNALDYLKDVRKSRQDLVESGGPDYFEIDDQRYGDLMMQADSSDGTVNIDYGSSGFSIPAQDAEEVAEALDELRELELPPPDPMRSGSKVVAERITSSGDYKTVLWEGGLLEVGPTDGFEDADGNLEIEPEDADAIADALEDLAETASKRSQAGGVQNRASLRAHLPGRHDQDAHGNDQIELDELGAVQGVFDVVASAKVKTKRDRYHVASLVDREGRYGDPGGPVLALSSSNIDWGDDEETDEIVVIPVAELDTFAETLTDLAAKGKVRPADVDEEIGGAFLGRASAGGVEMAAYHDWGGDLFDEGNGVVALAYNGPFVLENDRDRTARIEWDYLLEIGNDAERLEASEVGPIVDALRSLAAAAKRGAEPRDKDEEGDRR